MKKELSQHIILWQQQQQYFILPNQIQTQKSKYTYKYI